MIRKEFAVININADMHVQFYPDCGHVVIFDSKNNVVEVDNCEDLDFVEVRINEKIEDEKR